MVDIDEIVTTISSDRSKAVVTQMVESMQMHGVDMEAFFAAIPQTPLPQRWHLTWLLTHYVEAAPEKMDAYQVHIWELIQSHDHEGMQRDLWRSLTFLEIQEELAGAIFDRGTQIIQSPKYAIAVRVHAMQVAWNISVPYPDLSRELSTLLSALSGEDSVAIVSRAFKLNQQIKKRDSSE